MTFKLRLAVFFALYISVAFSQDAYILTKDNGKIALGDLNSVKISHEDKKVRYEEAGSGKNRSVKFSEIEEVKYDNYDLKPFPIDDNNKEMLYYIMLETKGVKLIGYSKVLNTNYLNAQGKLTTNSFMMKYSYFIVDDNFTVLEKLDFDGNYNEKSTKKRDEVEVILKKYFSDCPEFIGKLNAHDVKLRDLGDVSKRVTKYMDRMDKANVKIYMLFDNPEYITCNDPANKVEPIKQEQVLATPYDGNYKMGAYSVEKGMKRSMVSLKSNHGSISNVNPTRLKPDTSLERNDMRMKGSMIIKDGYFTFTNKDITLKYQIIAVKDGIIYYTEKGMTHQLVVEPETGKNSGFAYDTKITLIADKEIGGSTTFYYGLKE